MPPPIRICVVDDHPVLAEGIRKVVEVSGDITCLGVSTSAPALEAFLEQQQVDVIILDVRLGSVDGIELCASLRKRHPAVRVLMLSSFSDTGAVRRAFAAGASGYALKSITLDMVPAAIRQVNAGGVFLSPEIMLDNIQIHSRADLQSRPMTVREAEIVQSIAQGRTNKEIARDLGISSHTVKLHVSRLLKRFKFRSRSQLSHVLSTRDVEQP